MPFNTSNFAWLWPGIVKALGSVTAQKSAAKVSGIQLVLFVLRFEWCYNSVSFISHPYRCVYLPHGSSCYLQLIPAGSRITIFCNATSFMMVRCEDSHELSARCALYPLLLSSGHFTNLIDSVRIITVPRESPWPQGRAERQPYGRV